MYPDDVFSDVDSSLLRLSRAREAADLFGEGVCLLEKAEPCGEGKGILAVARYLWCSLVTARHVMTFNIAKRLLLAGQESVREEELLSAIGLPERDPRRLAELMRGLIDRERENVFRRFHHYKH